MTIARMIRRAAPILHNEAQALALGQILPFERQSDVLVLQVDGGDVKASGVLTFTGQPAADETVTVGQPFDPYTYTFKAALTGAAFEVLIGATLAMSIANLVAAINYAPGLGTVYGLGTTENPYVSAVGAATTVTVTSRIRGLAGNAIITTEVVALASWGLGTLAGGTAFVGSLSPQVALDDAPGHWTPIAAVPVQDEVNPVTVITAVGVYRINVAGVLLFRAPITAYTSGFISARAWQRDKSQG